MEEITSVLISWGIIGLIAAAFTEAFFSPILPDLILIPLALAVPEMAIYYGAVATVVSVIGGIVGYWIGHRVGPPAARRMIPEKHLETIQRYAKDNAVWAIVVVAMSPIPYKFMCITAGALRVNRTVFIGASLVGRAKRFMLEGVLIYYFGPQALAMLDRVSGDFLLISGAVLGILVLVLGVIWYKRRSALAERACD